MKSDNDDDDYDDNDDDDALIHSIRSIRTHRTLRTHVPSRKECFAQKAYFFSKSSLVYECGPIDKWLCDNAVTSPKRLSQMGSVLAPEIAKRMMGLSTNRIIR